MAAGAGPKVTNRGMTFYLDATNPKSAPASGTWIDLARKNGAATAYGNPTIGTLGGVRCYVLDEVGDRFTMPTDINNPSAGNATMEAWIYPAASELTGGDRGCIIQGHIYHSWNKGNQQLSNYWYSTSNQGYHEPGVTMAREQWHHIVAVYNTDTNELYQYVNGALVNTVATYADSSYVSGLQIGHEGDGRQFAGGFAVIKMHNVALTSEEVIRNYNDTRTKYGR